MTFKKPAAERVDSPTPEAIIDEHGEDPARFLRADVSLALARISGIDDLGLANTYKAIEKREFGSRSRILAAINKRIDHLVERDPRLHRVRLGPRRRRESNGGEATFLDENGEPYERTEHPLSTSLLDYRESSDSEAVADGGAVEGAEDGGSR